MSGIAIGTLAVAAIGTGYSIYSQNKAAKNAAQVDTDNAEFNSKYDIALAQQLDADTLQNIRTQRQEGKVYLSRQQAAYASAGVLATSGSPLAVQVTTAGRLEQQIQQQYLESQQKQASLYAKAKIGLLAGEAQASSDRAMGTLALINGGVSLARMGIGAYNSGLFSSKSSSTLPAGADLF